MNIAANKRIARTFKMARKYVGKTRLHKHGKREFICHAIEYAAHIACVITHDDCLKAKQIISKRLGRHETLQDWVSASRRAGAGIAQAVRSDTYSNAGRKMQRTRLAWLDSMIAEFGGAA